MATMMTIGDALAAAHAALLELRGPKGSPGWGSFYWSTDGKGYAALRGLESALDELGDPRGEIARLAFEPAAGRKPSG